MIFPELKPTLLYDFLLSLQQERILVSAFSRIQQKLYQNFETLIDVISLLHKSVKSLIDQVVRNFPQLNRLPSLSPTMIEHSQYNQR